VIFLTLSFVTWVLFLKLNPIIIKPVKNVINFISRSLHMEIIKIQPKITIIKSSSRLKQNPSDSPASVTKCPKIPLAGKISESTLHKTLVVERLG
jgi:hypothetical protein